MDEFEDSQLIDGFLRSDRKLTAVFVTLLLAVVRNESARRWASLSHRADEVESKALYLLTKWRDEDRKLAPHERKIDPSQTIQALGALLVNRAAVTERKSDGVEKKGREAAQRLAEAQEAASTPEDDAVAGDLSSKIWGLVGGLKASFQAVLRAQDAAQSGGPSLAEALAMEPAAARKLLERAREALLARARANKVELSPWLSPEERSHG